MANHAAAFTVRRDNRSQMLPFITAEIRDSARQSRHVERLISVRTFSDPKPQNHTGCDDLSAGLRSTSCVDQQAVTLNEGLLVS